MDLSVFDPELRFAARLLPRGLGRPWLLPLLRMIPVPSGRLPEGISLLQHRLSSDASVIGRMFTPSRPVEQPSPAVLWIHGGGYITSSAKQDDHLCARISTHLGMPVMSVDYRLAPEHPFPIPLDDCLLAFDYLVDNADSLAIDPNRIAIVGQSAGGGLAATLVQRLVDRGDVVPAFQLLIYPMLDARTTSSEDQQDYHRLWDLKSNQFGWSSYLGPVMAHGTLPEYAAAARRENLHGQPNAWLGVGALDLFYRETLEYAKRLREAGTTVQLEVVEGAFHGFDIVRPNAAVSQRFFSSQMAALAKALKIT
jgi:acetyl esterase/lipase